MKTRSFTSGSLVTTICLATLVWPAGASAQLVLKATAGPSTLNETHSASHILVTGTLDGAPGSYVCLPNKGCVVRPGYTNVSSKLIYDPEHETLSSCSGLDNPELGECTVAAGIVSARLDLKMGRLRVVAKKAPNQGSLVLNTVGHPARLVYAENSALAWPQTMTQSGLSSYSTYYWVRAGSYSIEAGPLAEHCKASQYAAASVVVPEGESTTSVDVLFQGNECTITVERQAYVEGGTGTVSSSPEGLTCPANLSEPCTGTFAFGTKITFTPQASGAANMYSWDNGCHPNGTPCTQTADLDRDLLVYFGYYAPTGTGGASGTGGAGSGGASGTGGAGTGGAGSGGAGSGGTSGSLGGGSSDDGSSDDGSSTDDGASGDGSSGDGSSGDDGSNGDDGTTSSGGTSGSSDGDSDEGATDDEDAAVGGCALVGPSSDAGQLAAWLGVFGAAVVLLRRRAARS